ncbi:MAG: hypothetical protein ACJ74Y_00390 [Bryobacteraceae bacterium]
MSRMPALKLSTEQKLQIFCSALEGAIAKYGDPDASENPFADIKHLKTPRCDEIAMNVTRRVILKLEADGFDEPSTSDEAV